MKLSYISLAVAAAFAVGDASANQVFVEQSGQSIWASGASAPTRAEYNAFVSNCTSAGHTIYMSGTSTAITTASRPGDASTGNFFMYRCTIDGTKTATFNTWDGQVVNMYHTVDGGSFVAFQPHLPNTPVQTSRIDPALTGCIAATGGTPTPGVTVFRNCAKTVASSDTGKGHRPDGGFADVEDDLWPTLNDGFNFAHKAANVTQLFGVAATEELYKAMQDQQKTLTDGRMDPLCATGDFTPGPCQPTIGSAEYRSLISQTAVGNYHNDWSPIVGAAGAGKTVRVCRRVESSGTQASSSTFFLENPCRQWNVQIGQLFPSTSASAEAEVIDNGYFYDVVENSGTGDVKACLTNSNGTSGVYTSKSGSSNGVAGDYVSDVNTNFAIGVMSMENVVGSSDKFKYLKLDNVSPNLDAKQRAAGAKGHYNFVMEMAYFALPLTSTKSNLTVSKAASLNPLVDISKFFDELAKDMSSPTVLDLNGLFISPAAGSPPDGDKVGYGSKSGQNCRPLELF